MSPETLARVRKNLETDGSNAMKLRAAGMRVVGGTDTGQTRFLIGYFNHLDLESMVAIGMTPLEAIKAATYDGAEIGHFDTRPRRARQERRLHRARRQSAGKHFQHAQDRQGLPAAARKSPAPSWRPSGSARSGPATTR